MGGCQKWQMKVEKSVVALSPIKGALETLHRVPTEVVRKSMRGVKREEVEKKRDPSAWKRD